MKKSKFSSLSQAVELYYDELQLFIRQRTGSSSVAEDVIQETWIRANTTSVDLPDNPRAYLYRMAGNLAVDHIRRQQAWDKAGCGENEKGDEVSSLLEDEPLSTEPEVVDIVIAQKEFAALNMAVQELPDKCREVFLLYRGQGLSMRQIAAQLSISEKTVEKHIARAMLHCRARLRDAGRKV